MSGRIVVGSGKSMLAAIGTLCEDVNMLIWLWGAQWVNCGLWEM